MANYLDITAAIEIKLQTLSTLPANVCYENTEIESSNGGLTLRTYLIPAVSYYPTLGDSPAHEKGAYQITIEGDENVGRGQAYTLAEALRTHFKRGDILTYNNVNVRIEKVQISPAFISDSKYKVPVRVHYVCYSN